MQGIIVLNPFLMPTEIIHQAERMKSELKALGVETKIVSNGWVLSSTDGTIASKLKGVDFAVFFDKDKYLSNVLDKLGVRVFNRHEAVRICDDKGETYLALTGHGIKIPETVFAPVCYSKTFKIKKEWLLEVSKRLGFPMVVKESYGSMGVGVNKVNNLEELIAISEDLKLKPHLYQKYVGFKPGTDVRVIVIGGKAVASMERKNEKDFRSNIALGGTGEKIELTKEFKETAESCAKILGLDYCGVDLLYGENNLPYVCEVNSNAFFSGIESVTKINVAGLYAKHIVESLG